MKLKLFFSHAWNDKAGSAVKKLQLLLQQDHDVWIDKRQIDIGDHINNTVAEGIAACDIFVCIWSRQAHQSKGVQFEIEEAAKTKKPILILRVEDFDINNSPWLQGREYIDFSGDDAAFAAKELYLQNFLLRKSLEKMQGTQPEKAEDVQQLNNKANSLRGVLEELEDIQRRQEMKASGNDHSNPYIQATMNSFERSLDNKTEEENILLRFSQRVKEISAQYPLQKDDAIKKQLTLATIISVDPHRKVERLSQLRQYLEGELAEPQSTSAAPAPVLAGYKNDLAEIKYIVDLYKQKVETTRQQVLSKAKSPFDSIPALSFLSSISSAATDFEMSYITSSPGVLEKLYNVAIASPNEELQTLVSILIKYITADDLEKAAASASINSYMHYAYLINNTARLLVQAGAVKQEEVSVSLLSSFGLDKVSKLFFNEGWKEKCEQFLDMVKNNYGIKDKNLDWMKAAAAIVGVVLVADALSGSDSDNTTASTGTVSTQKSEPYYIEDKMAAMGFTPPSNTVQY